MARVGHEKIRVGHQYDQWTCITKFDGGHFDIPHHEHGCHKQEK